MYTHLYVRMYLFGVLFSGDTIWNLGPVISPLIVATNELLFDDEEEDGGRLDTGWERGGRRIVKY